MMSVALKKRPPFNAVSGEETVKNQLEPGQNSIGDTPMLSHRSLLRNPSPKPTGVLEHCCEGENIC
jgi:hypothetical protein